MIPDNSVDAILDSPPYSTALDYVRNDLPQLTILGLVQSVELLAREMIGSPSFRYYSDGLVDEISQNVEEFSNLPDEAKSVIRRLVEEGQKKDALRTYKFFVDMRRALIQMKRVLKPKGRAVIIIGNNHYKLDGQYVEVKNDEVIARMAESLGMCRDKGLPLPNFELQKEELQQIEGGIRRRLEKTMTGMIRYETVLVLEKPS